MRGVTAIVALAGLLLASSSSSSKHEYCRGFVPENNENISVHSRAGGGLTEREFHSALDRVERYYRPVIARLGGTLSISRAWQDGTVNASAERIGRVYKINMFGGLARFSEMTVDGFTIVACHEMGHHIGGATKSRSWFLRWASNEGQSDYFAGLRCVRALWPAAENARFVSNNSIDPALAKECRRVWTRADEQNLCMRTGMAGLSTASLFRWLAKETVRPRFTTPDPRRVSQTNDSHPASQCRLDTYFQSGLCVHNENQPLSDRDVRIGTCTESVGYRVGNRPRCWYGERY